MHYAHLMLVLYITGKKQGKLRCFIENERLPVQRPLDAWLRLGTRTD